MRIKIKLYHLHDVINIAFRLVAIISFFYLTFPQAALSQLSSTAFMQNYTALQSTGEHEIIAGRNRFSSRLQYSFGSLQFQSEIELRQKYGDSRNFSIEPRELFAEIFTKNSDIRIGYQRVLWGRSQGSFVTDILSPFDLSDLTYTDASEIRKSIFALTVTRYFGSNSLQWILRPILTESNLSGPGSRWFPVPSFGEAVTVTLENNSRNRQMGLNTGLNYRLRSPSRLDSEFYLLYWRYPVPAFGYELSQTGPASPPDITLRTRSNSSLMAGFGSLYPLSDRFSLYSESLFVLSRIFTELPFNRERMQSASENNLLAIQLLQDFQNRDDAYTTMRPWLHSMIGMESEVAGFTVALQAHLEWIINHNEKIVSEALFPYLSVLISRSMFRERLHLLSLSRYNPAADDYWLQMEGNYEWSDLLELTLGINLFGGARPEPFYGHLSFHQFRRNSFIFSKVTLFF